VSGFRRVWALLLAVGSMAVLAPACVPPRVAAGRILVTAAFYPLAEAAQVVGGRRVEVVDLTPSGAEPHDVELTARDLRRLEDARVVVYVGGGFQPALDRALANRGKRSGVLDVVRTVSTLPGEKRTARDPHVWLDPLRYAQIVERVGRSLAEADPPGRDYYVNRAASYARELAGLDAEFRSGLSGCRVRTLVTAHGAFAYLAARYGFRQVAISGISPESEPNPRHLADVARTVRREKVTTVYFESLVSPKVAEALARETGARAAALNPIESRTAAEARQGKDYMELMREDLEALREGQGC